MHKDKSLVRFEIIIMDDGNAKIELYPSYDRERAFAESTVLTVAAAAGILAEKMTSSDEFCAKTLRLRALANALDYAAAFVHNEFVARTEEASAACRIASRDVSKGGCNHHVKQSEEEAKPEPSADIPNNSATVADSGGPLPTVQELIVNDTELQLDIENQKLEATEARKEFLQQRIDAYKTYG